MDQRSSTLSIAVIPNAAGFGTTDLVRSLRTDALVGFTLQRIQGDCQLALLCTPGQNFARSSYIHVLRIFARILDGGTIWSGVGWEQQQRKQGLSNLLSQARRQSRFKCLLAAAAAGRADITTAISVSQRPHVAISQPANELATRAVATRSGLRRHYEPVSMLLMKWETVAEEPQRSTHSMRQTSHLIGQSLLCVLRFLVIPR